MLPLALISGSRQKGALLTCMVVTFTLVSALNKYGQDTKHVAAKRQLYACVPSSRFEGCNQYGDLIAIPAEGVAAAKCHCLNGSPCDANGLCADGCEPGWYGPGCQVGNLGLGKIAWQSTTYAETTPIRTAYICAATHAVDGLTPINSSSVSCSHTSPLSPNNGSAWWAVILDVTRNYVITNVTIVNRQGVNSIFLTSFVILYSTATFSDPDPQNSEWREYARESGTVEDIRTYTSSNTVMAKRIAVYLTASPNNTRAILSLCEVQIYGYEPSAPPAGIDETNCHCLNGLACDANGLCANGCESGWSGPGCQVGNVALGKAAQQSSTLTESGYVCSANSAVDGTVPNDVTATYCSHTVPVVTSNASAWWAVTLDKTRYYGIYNVTLVNRQGPNSYRLANFVILYSNETVGDPDPSNSTWREYARENGTVGYNRTYTSTNMVTAKRVAVYLRSFSQNPGALLTLCEVKIYGYEIYGFGLYEPPAVPASAICHCLNGSACDVNGWCTNGCESGWYGFSCQVGNVALRKVVRQSSTYSEPGYTGSANLAVDGRWASTVTLTPTDCSHTQVFAANNASWWAVTLDTTRYYFIFNITLVNRLGSTSNRLANFVILYTNATEGDPDPRNSIWLEYARENGVVGYTATYTSIRTAIAKRVAVYLMASPSNTGAVLTLCEVQIYGYEPSAPSAVPAAANCHCLNGLACDANGLCANGCESGWYGPGCQVGNLALGKAARQSTTYYYPGYTNVAGLAVDGIVPNDTSATYCTHTNTLTTINAVAWWVVTLDTTRYSVITNITLVNRQGYFSYRLANFVILYSNTTEGDPDPKSSTWRAYSQENGTVGYTRTYTSNNMVIAKRVAVYLKAFPGNTEAILSLCEVQIYGYEPIEKSVAFSRMSTAAPWTVSGWITTDPCCPYVYFDFGRLYKVCGFESASAVNAATFVNLEVRVGNSTTKNSDGFFVNPVCTFVDALTSGMREFYPCRDFRVGRYISFMLVGAAVPGPLTVSYFKVFASM